MSTGTLNHRYLTFKHSELGDLEVLVMGTTDEWGIGVEGFKVYHGPYDITRDLSDEDRNEVLRLTLGKTIHE